jgi:hypothetical protein
MIQVSGVWPSAIVEVRQRTQPIRSHLDSSAGMTPLELRSTGHRLIAFVDATTWTAIFGGLTRRGRYPSMVNRSTITERSQFMGSGTRVRLATKGGV